MSHALQTILIFIASVLCLLGGATSLGFTVLVSADAEGRGSTYAMWGLLGTLFGFVGFVGLAVWALIRCVS